jgi:SAM-dependent methyltransferase
MKVWLLKYIWCPECHSDLTVSAYHVNGEIHNGVLTCTKCDNKYMILDGIPRFVDSINGSYTESFGYEWNRLQWDRKEKDEKEFWAITDLKPESFKDKVVLDVGCGGGRLVSIVSQYSKEVIGFDYSNSVNKAQEFCHDKSNVNFVQCDVNKHPFKPYMFDIVYSHGVLHHTPNTKKSFDNIPNLVKKGGVLYIAVFRKSFILLQWSDWCWRSIVNRMSHDKAMGFCKVVSNLQKLPYGSFIKRFFWFSLQQLPEIRLYSLWDWYTPKYHHEHTVQEVKGWFGQSGFTDVKYINAFPYCKPEHKYHVPDFTGSFRLGQLLGVIGRKSI